MVPAAGTATLEAGWLFILIVAAGTVPGGVVAIQIGINFYYLPVALSAKSVGTVLLPRLSREALHDRLIAGSARPTTAASRGRGSSQCPRRSRC